MNFLALIAMGAGGFILFCLGKSTQGTQKSQIAATGDVNIIGGAPSDVTKQPPITKATSTPVARVPMPVSVAAGSIYGAYTTTILPQTRRFQGLF